MRWTGTLGLLWVGAMAGCWATPSTPSGAPPPPTDERGFAPGPARFRRLVASQYRNAVTDLLGTAAAEVSAPPSDPSLNGLKGIAASELAMSAADVAAYEASARLIVAAAEAETPLGDRFAACGDTPAASCVRAWVDAVLDQAFRRAAEDAEIDRYVALFGAIAAREGHAEAGYRAVVTAALQSPCFLYRTEVGEPMAEQPGFRRLSNDELAGRIAFFLTDRPPAAALREAAATGRLSTAQGLAAEVDRLLATPAARAALSAFYDEYLRLGELAKLVKDPNAFPLASPDLLADMRTETLSVIEDVVWRRDVDFREMFRARYTIVNERLMGLYGLSSEGTEAGWRRVDFDDGALRGGYLGQASFLALNSHPVSSSPTLRGKFVQEVLLCQAIPAPPPDVNTEFPEPEPGQAPLTTRERVALHLSNETCAGCHRAMDPIGLGLENFDALGAFRSRENGVPIDASSTFEGTDFVGAAELGDIIAASDRAAFCVVRNLFRHATGHVEATWEEPALQEVDAVFADSGYRIRAAMRALVMSDAFRLVSEY